jgi:DUF218 domain
MDLCDGILVLGGGVREGGGLPPWVVPRFERALELRTAAPIVCLSAGTVHHAPPLNAGGYPILESVAGAAYLFAQGVPQARVQVETNSYDTIGNAYFAKLLHADPAGWRKLVVITSEFHIPRTKAIFDWVFGLGKEKYELRYEATPNEGLTGDLLQRRRAKEAASLEALQHMIENIQDFRCLHQWIQTEHRAYSAEGWIGRRASPPDIADLY